MLTLDPKMCMDIISMCICVSGVGAWDSNTLTANFSSVSYCKGGDGVGKAKGIIPKNLTKVEESGERVKNQKMIHTGEKPHEWLEKVFCSNL